MQNQIPKNLPVRSRKAKEGWQKVKLEDVTETTDFVANGSFASLREHVKYKDTKDYAVLVRSTDLKDNFRGKLVYVNEHAFNFLKKSKLEGGEVIISNVGNNVGDVYRCPDLSRPMTLGPNAVSLKAQVNDFFYYYFLNKNGQAQLRSIVSGSGQPKFNKTDLRNLYVVIPTDFEIQKKIASYLSKIDDKIEVNNKITKTLEEMAQALFKEWFVCFRFPEYEKAEFVDSELGKIPKGWEIKKIKNSAKINKGISYSSEEIKDNSVGLPMINLANFQRGGGFNPDGIKFYTGRYKKTDLVKPGDIVIAMTDLTSNREVIGHPARVPSYAHWNEILISLDVCSIETEDSLVEFLYYLMLRKDFSYQMASSAGGTNVAHLSKAVIENYSFTLPEKSLIEEFQSFVKPIFNRINIIELENQKLADLRDLLLPKLMKGEIKV